jgi:tripartite-type tricarboxylate transporter receptor subunit TctC
MADSAIQKFAESAGIISLTSTPEELHAHVQDQIKLWGRWAKESGLTAN